MGCDLWSTRLQLLGDISIHAPTWGATRRCPFRTWRASISIHAPTWGATYPQMEFLSPEILFQSTHPRGVRLHDKARLRTRGYFNPRTHVGCDSGIANLTGSALISIHAPTWGATADFYHLLYMDEISIHAPTWGATLHGRLNCRILRFQSTHPRGVRLLSHQMVGF